MLRDIVFLETQTYTYKFPNVPFVKITDKKDNIRKIIKTYFKNDIIEFKDDIYISLDRLTYIVENNIVRNNYIFISYLSILNTFNMKLSLIKDEFLSTLSFDLKDKKELYNHYYNISNIRPVEDLYFLRLTKYIQNEKLRLHIINMFDIDIIDNFILKIRWKTPTLNINDFYNMYIKFCEAHEMRCISQKAFKQRISMFFNVENNIVYNF